MFDNLLLHWFPGQVIKNTVDRSYLPAQHIVCSGSLPDVGRSPIKAAYTAMATTIAPQHTAIVIPAAIVISIMIVIGGDSNSVSDVPDAATVTAALVTGLHWTLHLFKFLASFGDSLCMGFESGGAFQCR